MCRPLIAKEPLLEGHQAKKRGGTGPIHPEEVRTGFPGTRNWSFERWTSLRVEGQSICKKLSKNIKSSYGTIDMY